MTLRVSLPHVSGFLQDHFIGNIHDLLNRKPDTRPTATDVFNLFVFYCQFLELPNSKDLINVRHYPSYSEFKELVQNHAGQQEKFYSVVDLYEKKREGNAAISLRTKLVTEEAISKYNATKTLDGPNLTSLEHCLADVFLERGYTEHAIDEYKMAIEKHPMNFWLWHKLCKIFLEKGDYARAIAFCRTGLSQDLNNPAPVLELMNLYAADEDFINARSAFSDFELICRRLALHEDLTVIFTEKLDLHTSDFKNSANAQGMYVSPVLGL